MTDEKTSKESIQRLKILEEHQDGFIIAEKDLINRGEGDIIGRNQSGTKFRKIACLNQHASELEKAINDLKKFENESPDSFLELLTRPPKSAVEITS